MESGLPPSLDAVLPREPAPVPRVHSFKFHGLYPDLLVLQLKNMFLTLITVGFYFAWARTARRNYLWQNVEFDGHRVEYHGTARELFKAYVKVFSVYFLFVVASLALQKLAPLLYMVSRPIVGVGFLLLIPWAIYRARGYLLSRTSWRGIRMSMDKDEMPFVRAYAVGWLLSLVTLGIYTPWRMNQLQRALISHTKIGTWHFRYDGVDGEVARIFFKGLLLSVLTLGIYAFWMRAELLRYYANHTILDNARGKLDLRGGDLLLVFLASVVLVPLSLGLAAPWLAILNLRLKLDRLSFEGHIAFDSLMQTKDEAARAVADGVAEIFDVGAGF